MSLQACINYGDHLEVSLGHDDLSASPTVHRIFTTERDAIISQELQSASQHQSDCIVGIVGSGHVPGILHSWNASEDSAAGAGVVPSAYDSDLTQQQGPQVVPLANEVNLTQQQGPKVGPLSNQASLTQQKNPQVVPMADEASLPQHEEFTTQGVKRAMLERFIELSCNAAVCAELQQQLSPLPVEALWAYEHVQQLYGSSTRMMLAALPREHLSKVTLHLP